MDLIVPSLIIGAGIGAIWLLAFRRDRAEEDEPPCCDNCGGSIENIVCRESKSTEYCTLCGKINEPK